MSERKTMVEIIDETAAFYKLSNRGTDERGLSKAGNGCLYNGTNGTHCAFARLCINPFNLKEGIPAAILIQAHGHNILKEEYRGYPDEFYRELQDLHDTPANWTDTGVSESGKHYVEALRIRWGEREI